MVECWVILAPPFDFNGAGHRRRLSWPCQHALSSRTGADGPQAAVDYRMRRHHGYCVSLFFFVLLKARTSLGRSKKKGSDVKLGGSRENWKVTKTKDLDMVKNFFLLTRRWSLKFKNGASRTLFMCRNWYKTYDTVGFVPGCNIFYTFCTTQDENQSVSLPSGLCFKVWTSLWLGHFLVNTMSHISKMSSGWIWKNEQCLSSGYVCLRMV